MAWLCLWTDVLDCEKLAELDDTTFRGWILLLACAKRHDAAGALPSLKKLAYWCRYSEREVKAWLLELEDHGLLDRDGDEFSVHDWDHWQPRTPGRKPGSEKPKTNAERQRLWRENHPRTAVTDVTPPLDSPKENNKKEERRSTLPLRNENVFVTNNVTPPQIDETTLIPNSIEWKIFHCIKQGGEKWGASNGEAVVNDLLRTFDPDIVMEAMDQCWNRFQAELKPAYLRKCCEGKHKDFVLKNGKP